MKTSGKVISHLKRGLCGLNKGINLIKNNLLILNTGEYQ
jgi:hypothetical protein